MKLATLSDGSRDGRLVVVSRDLTLAALAEPRTLQNALDAWDEALPALNDLYRRLNHREVAGAFAFETSHCLAPLPRAYQWLDASAFLAHGELMAKAFRINNPQGATPLVYQGASDRMLGPAQDVPFPSVEHGIDFEGEFGVILGDVPMMATAEEAQKAIRLLVLINDWSLRTLAPSEMKTGFGWIAAKPATSFGPVAVTPDELGDRWVDGRIHLPLHVSLNGRRFGEPFGGAMDFGFPDIIRHVTATRALGAGTILGSGTVSEGDPDRVGSACIAERRGFEIIQSNAATTDFLSFGDTVRIEALGQDGQSIFGAIDQTVVRNPVRPD
ncbi:fumarylacetoacetate hydrolase family protein [Microvirga calopogonii]|uniref:fumarylacetoacetate hydrolase family protein n=1 Tax=Microvirga calopogonii TaxID=2078013 RepID=UPI000E0DA2AA|nr:fumarylacetoacetate hydrolase family protein [Microvirga calopogonii]